MQELFSLRVNVVDAQVTSLASDFPSALLSVAQFFCVTKLKGHKHEIIHLDILYGAYNSAFILLPFQQGIRKPISLPA